jgi:nucleoside-diphosphate-sugar epimerase
VDVTSPATHARGARSGAVQDTLTVAVTGTSGTIGPALLERLAGADGVGRIFALGRRATEEMRRHDKVSFRGADVRDQDALEQALDGADAVVHLAFSLYGVLLGESALFDTNVAGTSNVARAAGRVGARRFVYTSSAAVYGRGGAEDHPLREDAELHAPARLFYARHKAQAEVMVSQELAGSSTEAYVFRPCAIAGPHAAGALASRIPGPLLGAGHAVPAIAAKAGLRPALPAPAVPLQFVHEDDVAQALALAVEGAGPGGIYNLAGDGWLPGPEVIRTLGFRRIPLPGSLIRASLDVLASVPPLLPAFGWPELVHEPLLLDTSKVKRKLGWRPRFGSREALEATRAAIGW